jgi:hypothetical protein
MQKTDTLQRKIINVYVAFDIDKNLYLDIIFFILYAVNMLRHIHIKITCLEYVVIGIWKKYG